MVYQLQVLIPMTTALPADTVTNSFHINAVSDADLITATASWKTFYLGIAGHFPSTVAQAGWRFKAFNLDDPQPRAPVYEETWNLAATPAGQTLPSECAMVLSFQAAPASGDPQARRRNRVYIGPLDSALIGADGRFTGASLTTLVNAANDLEIASAAAANWSWVVWSAIGQVPLIIDNGWVDNAVDTQRRRGVKATTRTVFTA